MSGCTCSCFYRTPDRDAYIGLYLCIMLILTTFLTIMGWKDESVYGAYIYTTVYMIPVRVTSWVYSDEPAMFLAHKFNEVALAQAGGMDHETEKDELDDEEVVIATHTSKRVMVRGKQKCPTLDLSDSVDLDKKLDELEKLYKTHFPPEFLKHFARTSRAQIKFLEATLDKEAAGDITKDQREAMINQDTVMGFMERYTKEGYELKGETQAPKVQQLQRGRSATTALSKGIDAVESRSSKKDKDAITTHLHMRVLCHNIGNPSRPKVTQSKADGVPIETPLEEYNEAGNSIYKHIVPVQATETDYVDDYA